MVKLSDIATQNGFDVAEFTEWAQANSELNKNMFGTAIYDSDASHAIEMYKSHKKAQADKVQKEKERREAIASILITSGYSFDGYTITKYSGYISGDDAVEIPRSNLTKWFSEKNDNGQNLTNALVRIRLQAIKELKEAAYDLDCNAIVGVDFDYITLEPETANSHGGTTYEPYIICVTANGNAVVIEKNS